MDDQRALLVYMYGMNNTGVDHLMRGRFHTACSVFSNTFRMAEAFIVNELSAVVVDGEGDLSVIASDMFQTAVIPEKDTASGGNKSEGTLASLEGTFVYRRAITLKHEDERTTTPPRIETLCVVLLYNTVSSNR